MERLKIQVIEMHDKQSGFSTKYQKHWELQKVKVRVLEAGNPELGTQVIEALFWGDKIKYFLSKDLKPNSVWFFEGDLKKSSYSKQIELNIKSISPAKITAKDKDKIAENITDELTKDWYELNSNEPIHPLAIMAVNSNVHFSLVQAYLSYHSEEINYVDKNGFTAAMHLIKRKKDTGVEDFVDKFLSIPNLDFNVKTPNGNSLVDLVLFSGKHKLQESLYKQIPNQIAVLNPRENKKVLSTSLGSLLIKEKIVLGNLGQFKELDFLNCSTIEQVVARIDNNYTKAIVRDLSARIKIKKGFGYSFDFGLFELTSRLLQDGVDINHVQTILSQVKDVVDWIVFFNFKQMLTTNQVEFSQFLLNNLELVDNKKIKQYIADANKAYQQFKKENVNIDLVIFGPKINNIERLHDQVSLYLKNYRQAGINQLLNLETKYPCLQKMPMELENLEVKIPQDSHTLCNWGTAMNNCVATFIKPCLYQKTIILGFFDKQSGKIIANAEITNNSIRQLYGPNNSRLPRIIDEKIKKFIHEHVVQYKDKELKTIFSLG